MCVWFYSSFVFVFAHANVYFKTTIIKQNIKTILIAGVPSSQALPGFLISAPPSVCVPDVIGVLAVWIQNPKKKRATTQEGRGFEEGRDGARAGPGRGHGLLMHARNRIPVPREKNCPEQ